MTYTYQAEDYSFLNLNTVTNATLFEEEFEDVNPTPGTVYKTESESYYKALLYNNSYLLKHLWDNAKQILKDRGCNALPENVTDYLLMYNGFDLAVKNGKYREAAEFWTRLHDTSVSSSVINSGCNCKS